MRLKISLIGEQRQGLSEILCLCTKSTEGKNELIFSSQLLPLLLLKLHLITNAGSKKGTGREKPGKTEVAKLTRAEFQGVKCWAWDCSTCRLLRSPLPFCPLGWSPWYDSSPLFLHASFYPRANASWVGRLSEIAQEGQLCCMLVFIKLFALSYKINFLPSPHILTLDLQSWLFHGRMGWKNYICYRGINPCKRQQWTKTSISKYQVSWNTSKQK